jgi:sec-independent protein translocase protein TatA
MFGLGTTELIVIGVIVFLIFGAKRIPEIGKGLGGALREFRNVKGELTPDKKNDTPEGEAAAPGEKSSSSIEKKLAQKVVQQVPGVKKAMDVKNKVEKVKKMIE